MGIVNKKTKIISIAAVSGGGKTTITESLAHELKNSRLYILIDINLITVRLIFANGLMMELITMNGYLHR
ncbi:putative uridine kinase [Bacillus cereus]|nr:putative uridine kinase [Bacillus cereus]